MFKNAFLSTNNTTQTFFFKKKRKQAMPTKSMPAKQCNWFDKQMQAY
jgi:hypothetical protein